MPSLRTRRTTRLLAIALALAAGALRASAQDDDSPDHVVYREVIKARFHHKPYALIRQPYVPSADDVRRGASALPPALAASLDRAMRAAPRTLEPVIGEVKDHEWIDSTGVLAKRANGTNVIRFAIWLSPIGYDRDGQTAVLYVRTACGPLCGEEELVILRRESKKHWDVERVVAAATF